MFTVRKTVLNKNTFYREILKKSEEKKELRNIFIELLDFCNFNCKYCYVKNTYNSMIDYSAVLKILDQAREMGCIWITLSGGECLIHPYFKDIYKYAFEKGLKVIVLTNGYNITSEICELFKEMPPFNLDITLYGYNNKTYDEFVGVSGAFDVFKSKLELLVANRIKFGLKTVLTTNNYKDLQLYIQFAHKYTKQYRYDTIVIPTLNGKTNLDLRLNAKTVVEIEEKNPYYVKVAKDAFVSGKKDNRLYKCSGGLNTICIDPNLNVSYCAISKQDISFKLDPDNIDISEAHKWLIEQHEHTFLNKEDKCFDCKYKNLCNYCPARFALETGNNRNPPSWYCDLARLEYEKIKGK